MTAPDLDLPAIEKTILEAHYVANVDDLIKEILSAYKAQQSEIGALKHDLERYMDIANLECQRAEAAEAEVERVRAALREFTDWADHTRVFLTSREKMHPIGVEQWDEAVVRAVELLVYHQPKNQDPPHQEEGAPVPEVAGDSHDV